MFTDFENIISRFISRIKPTDEQEYELKTLINEAKTIKQDSKLKDIMDRLNEFEKDSLDNGSFFMFDPGFFDDVIEIIEDYI